MLRKGEVETGKVITVVKDFGDTSLYVGFHSVLYTEKDFRNRDNEYFYDASDNKLYVRHYRLYIEQGKIEIRE